MMRREIGTDVSSKDELTTDSTLESRASRAETACNHVFQLTPLKSGSTSKSAWPLTCPNAAARLRVQNFCLALANATGKAGDPFLTPIDQMENFPEGCFYMPADAQNPTTTDKFYFNPIGAAILKG